MTNKQRELRRDYLCGDLVSVAAMIKAGFFRETEATKMLTAQLHTGGDHERITAKRRIERAGYVIEMTGQMTRSRVYEVVL